ncbi:MAG TPA: PQQ-dependent sugar dehydrogenase, partial [Candidatus Acidoferrum sp.]|nr:PQQ-dependent sugar dehydrogenase [Candidatus Acidoferrum sp.]
MRLSLGLLLASCAFAQEIRTVQVAAGVAGPTDIQTPGDGSGRLFIVQQSGTIRILKNGTVLPTPFLDIHTKITSDGERGLLGLAFPPGFAQKQRFYIDYTDLNGNTVIAQYRVTANPDVADPASEIALLHITQPFTNHKGGQVRFGPDGYLYIAMGDGGSGGDPMGNGQNLNALLGKLLRIDVESTPGQVRIPPDNPFVNQAGARGEIWAYGLRNPWRFSFDRANRDLWIADVGQDTYEEVDLQPAASHGGENYGWNRMEGLHCFTAGCSMQGLTLPVAEYSHAGGACSISGGFRYRGNLSPGLRGTYIYGDFCDGRIAGLEWTGSAWASRLLLATNFGITTFGEDEAGEVYVADAKAGTIYRIEGSRAPRFNTASVTNPASFAGGMVAGSLATVFAAGVRDAAGASVASQLPLPGSIGGVSVTVAGIAAPVYAIANVSGQEQVTFQVPWAIAGRTTAPVIVTRDGNASAAVDVPVIAIQPGVFVDNGRAVVVRAA